MDPAPTPAPCSLGMCGFAALGAVGTERAEALSSELCRVLGGTVGLYLLVGLALLFSPLQNESELFGRTIRVNLAKPMRIKEGSSRPGELGSRASLGVLGALCIS